MAEPIFADTSGLVAKFLENDQRHSAADRAMRDFVKEGRKLLTTDYIFDEMMTRIRTIARHEDAVSAGEYLLAAGKVVRMIEVDRRLRDEGWRIFKKCKDQEFSFTDCTSFAAMEKYGVKEAFSFDDDFRKMGFLTLPRT